jgi:butyryl-CoA dehydrogenase
MDFSLTSVQIDFQKWISHYMKTNLAPVVSDIENAHQFPMEFYMQLAEDGLLGINFPEKYGGKNADCITCALLIEETSKYCSSVAGSITTAGMTAPYPLLILGSEAQKEKYLYGVPTGEIITAFAISEPDAGSDVTRLSTRGVRDGDHYLINGTKIFISNGSVAHIFLVVADTSSGDQEKNFSLFLVERDTPGLSVSKKFDKLGWVSQDTTEVAFNDVRVPKENLIGKEGDGLAGGFSSISFTRILLAITGVGVAESALNRGIEYSKNTKRSGKALIRQQSIRAELAELATEVEAARLMVFRAAWMHDRGVRNRKEVAMSKYYATELAKKVTKAVLRIHGVEGFFTHHQAAIFFADTPVFTIADGTSQIQLENISRELGMLKSGEMGT